MAKIHRWNLDETSGNFIDTVGGANGVPTVGVVRPQSLFGGGVTIPAQTDNIDCGNPADLQITSGPVTFRAIFAANPDSTVYQDIFGKYLSSLGAGNRGYQLQVRASSHPTTANELAFIFDSGGTGYGLYTTPITDGVTHDAVITDDGTNLIIYVDGVVAAQMASVRPWPNAATNFIIGNNGDAGNRAGNIVIDQIEIWNTALSSTTVRDLYYKPAGGLLSSEIIPIDLSTAVATNLNPLTLRLDPVAPATAVDLTATVITSNHGEAPVVYDGSLGGYQTGWLGTVVPVGVGGQKFSFSPANGLYETYAYALNAVSASDLGNPFSTAWQFSTATDEAVYNSGFESEAGGEAGYWRREGIVPAGDLGVGSGVMDPGSWWQQPEGVKVEVLTSVDPNSLVTDVETRSQVLDAVGGATIAGTLAKRGWASYIIPGTLAISVAAVPTVTDDGLGALIDGGSVVVGDIDYFTGNYSLTVGLGQVTCGYKARVSGHSRGLRTEDLISPRDYNSVSFYRRVEIPATPLLAAGSQATLSLLADSSAVWSEVYGPGDEGLVVDSRVLASLPPLASYPNLHLRWTWKNGSDDVVFVDHGGADIEAFGAWSDWKQTRPNTASDPAISVDGQGSNIEYFAHWLDVAQPLATTQVFADTLTTGWGGQINGQAFVQPPTYQTGFSNSVYVAPATYQVLATTPGHGYVWEHDTYSGSEIAQSGIQFGSFLMSIEFTLGHIFRSTTEFVSPVGGNVWEGRRGAAIGGEANFTSYGGSDNVHALLAGFHAQGTAQAFEFWCYHTHGSYLNFYENGHYLWTDQDPLAIYVLPTHQQTQGNSVGARTVLQAPAQMPSDCKLVVYNNDNIGGNNRLAKWGT